MRRYGQACPLARSLDLVGDRWTLFIIRELLLGPRSFKDLHAAFQGISTNQLTIRIQDLVAQGLIHKDSRNAPYELTAQGDALRPTVYELIRWSYLNDLGNQPDESPNPRWDLLTLHALLRADPPKRLNTQINLTLEAIPFHLTAKSGKVQIGLDHTAVSAAHVQTTHSAFRHYCQTPTKLLPQGLQIEGDDQAALALLRLFRAPHSIR